MRTLPEPVVVAVGEVLENLAFLIPQGPVPADGAAWDLVMEVRFNRIGDDLSGLIRVAFTTGLLTEAARNLGGLEPDVAVSASDLRDTAAELANVVAGNLLPQLTDEGEGFNLSTPEPLQERDLPPGQGVCIDFGSGLLAISIEPDLV